MSTLESSAVPRISFGSAGIMMTPEEFDAITDYDECYEYELIHGVLVVNPIPSEAEADANQLLGNLLFVYKENHPLGGVLDATLSGRYLHTQDSRRKVGRVIWVGLGKKPWPREKVPKIVVDFVSREKASWLRDYFDKRRECMAVGVKEYWIIDRFRRTLTVCREKPSEATELVVKEPETYRSEYLPGFELPLAQILAAADSWPEDGLDR